MRITGGSLIGRKILCPKGIIRPMPDHMRESLFAFLGNIEGMSFLDLFSGSGIIGIEAYSRGARHVTMVERDKIKLPTLKANITGLDPAPAIRIEPAEHHIKRNALSYNILCLDPPFQYRFSPDLLKKLGSSALLHVNSKIIIHTPRQKQPPADIPPLRLYERRNYGGSVLTVYQYQP